MRDTYYPGIYFSLGKDDDYDEEDPKIIIRFEASLKGPESLPVRAFSLKLVSG